MMNHNLPENGRGGGFVGVNPMINIKDDAKWLGIFHLAKWDWKGNKELQAQAEKEMKAGARDDVLREKYGEFLVSDEDIGQNLLLNAGINTMLTQLAGGAGTTYSNANARIGVGDSTTAAAASQTALQAASNKLLVAMDASFPTYGSSQQIVFRSSFTSGQANYAWQEFVVDNGGTALVALNRLVSAQGTKTSGQTWQVTVTITVS